MPSSTKKPTVPKKKTAVPKAVKPVKVVKAKPTGPELSVVGIDGKVTGKVSVPKELFAAPVNKQLLAQAVRVYLANQRTGGADTKTRGEVEGSTRKIYKQKGTGRARHGAIRAPIFVGGGITFGPKPRDYRLNMPAKMRKIAVASALTSQFAGGNIIVVDGLEKLEPKTKKFASAFTNIGAKKKTLFIVPKDGATLVRATRNMAHVDSMPFSNINAYAILSHNKVVFTKDAMVNFTKSNVA